MGERPGGSEVPVVGRRDSRHRHRLPPRISPLALRFGGRRVDAEDFRTFEDIPSASHPDRSANQVAYSPFVSSTIR